VVTDLKMPRMNGFTLLAHIIEHYPDMGQYHEAMEYFTVSKKLLSLEEAERQAELEKFKAKKAKEAAEKAAKEAAEKEAAEEEKGSEGTEEKPAEAAEKQDT